MSQTTGEEMLNRINETLGVLQDAQEKAVEAVRDVATHKADPDAHGEAIAAAVEAAVNEALGGTSEGGSGESGEDGGTGLVDRMTSLENRFDERGKVRPANLPLATPDTPGIVQPDGTTCTVENGLLTALGVNKLYDLKDRDLSLYVRPDGNDENDGLVDSPERAWSSIDHAVEWINERRFTGAGWITVRVADGTYTATGKRAPLACNGAQFANSMLTFPNGPTDPVNPLMWGTCRIRIIGNISDPSRVIYTIPSSLPLTAFTLSSVGVYGLTLSIQPGASSQIRGAVVYSNSAGDGYMGNCILQAGPDTGVANSPYTVFRGGGRLFLYGSITVRASSMWSPYYLWWPEDGGYYNFGHYAANMAGSGALYVLEPLRCRIESTVSGVTTAYYAGPVGTPTTGFVRDPSSTISAVNPPANRYYIEFPNTFYSQGTGASFFPGARAGVASMPSSLYF